MFFMQLPMDHHFMFFYFWKLKYTKLFKKSRHTYTCKMKNQTNTNNKIN